MPAVHLSKSIRFLLGLALIAAPLQLNVLPVGASTAPEVSSGDGVYRITWTRTEVVQLVTTFHRSFVGASFTLDSTEARSNAWSGSATVEISGGGQRVRDMTTSYTFQQVGTSSESSSTTLHNGCPSVTREVRFTVV